MKIEMPLFTLILKSLFPDPVTSNSAGLEDLVSPGDPGMDLRSWTLGFCMLENDSAVVGVGWRQKHQTGD